MLTQISIYLYSQGDNLMEAWLACSFIGVLGGLLGKWASDIRYKKQSELLTLQLEVLKSVEESRKSKVHAHEKQKERRDRLINSGKWISGKDLINKFNVSVLKLTECLKEGEISLYSSSDKDQAHPQPQGIIYCWQELADTQVEKHTPNMSDIGEIIENSTFNTKGIAHVLR